MKFFSFRRGVQVLLATCLMQVMSIGAVAEEVDMPTETVPVIQPVVQVDPPLSFKVGALAYTKGDVKGQFSIAPYVKNGVTMVPLRSIGQMFGAQVEWVQASKQINIINSRGKITLQAGNKVATVNNSNKVLLMAPEIIKGTTMVPIRFVAEELKTEVHYAAATKEIRIKPLQRAPIAKFSTDKQVYETGESVKYTNLSTDPDGDEIVQLVWNGKEDKFDKPGKYDISLQVVDSTGLWSDDVYHVTIEVVPFNNPPEAHFTISDDEVDQGQPVTYKDLSSDPDGDKIVEVRWENNEPAWFEPGPQVVTLKVKDARGKWSAPYAITVEVSELIKYNRFEFFLKYPDPGRPLLLPKNPLDFNLLEPEHKDLNRTLIISNSPEPVNRSGLLYKDQVRGKMRILYHHKNISGVKKKFYILVENPNSYETNYQVVRRSVAGPAKDDLAVGSIGAYKFLDSKPAAEVTLQPYEVRVLNEGETPAVANDSSIYGIYDIDTNDELIYHVVVLDADSNVFLNYKALYPFERLLHNRGTFAKADRELTVTLPKKGESSRLVLADGKIDPYVTGYDAMDNNAETIVKGNYGVFYEIKVKSGNNMGMLINPRGGNFAGAISTASGTTVRTPKAGFVQKNDQGILIGKVTPEGETIYFMPPASSFLPVNLLFVKEP